MCVNDTDIRLRALTSRITSIHIMKFDDFSHFVDHLSTLVPRGLSETLSDI